MRMSRTPNSSHVTVITMTFDCFYWTETLVDLEELNPLQCEKYDLRAEKAGMVLGCCFNIVMATPTDRVPGKGQ